METRQLHPGFVRLVMEPQLPSILFSILAVLGCTMPVAAIHTNHERRVNVDVENAMEPLSMGVHKNKPVLDFRA